ncbi:CCR4-NOT transcription complex subunit 10-B [Striga asiatica]|uniref:CCR4-NOT transcription complex subunit 10-B n=1 Tax=Striga asiatica TaxID=4170 RepID=A0A5A7R2N5_STRAF|nr:CCR4-NOT transcription complex subunit 10-B [Striga asiatica]
MLRSCKLAGKSNNGGGKVRATGTGEGRLTEPSQSRSMLWRSNPMLRRHRRATATVGTAITVNFRLPSQEKRLNPSVAFLSLQIAAVACPVPAVTPAADHVRSDRRAQPGAAALSGVGPLCNSSSHSHRVVRPVTGMVVAGTSTGAEWHRREPPSAAVPGKRSPTLLPVESHAPSSTVALLTSQDGNEELVLVVFHDNGNNANQLDQKPRTIAEVFKVGEETARKLQGQNDEKGHIVKVDEGLQVRHNIAIAENFQDGCSDPKRLIGALENILEVIPILSMIEPNTFILNITFSSNLPFLICLSPHQLVKPNLNTNIGDKRLLKQSEELAHTSAEPLEITSNDGRKSMAVVKGPNNAVHQLSSSSVYNDDFDTSVAMFNLAVIWFHLHDYAKSFSYLETFYRNIEPIDEATALRICLLLLDVALVFHHASRSADVISYMEKVFCVNNLISQVDNGTSAHQQSSSVSKPTSLASNSTVTDSSHTDSVAANTLENSLARTLSEEALEDESLQLLSFLNISGQNVQRLSSISPSHDLSRSQSENSLSVADLRLKLHLYKVRFFLLTRNLKAAKREVKMAMNLARGKDYPLALYLKSQLEYARRNHRKAIKLLMASSNRTETGISSMYYNNLGCIYYQLGKYHTSGIFFSKALKGCSLVRKGKPPKLLTLSQDKSLLISYNCGMHAFACGRPFHAARCFQKASLIFYNRPLLWLRIADCCLMALEKGLITPNFSAPSRSDIRVNVIGKGKWRHLALSYDDSSVSDGKQPELSISLAWHCLVNALYLLDSSKAKYSVSGSSPLGTMENESKEKTLQTNHTNVGDGNPRESNSSSGPGQVISNGQAKEQKSGNNSSASLQNSVNDFDNICMKENHMMKQAVLANLAYVELALGNPLEALSTAKSLLELPECSKIYIFLGTIYAAEALCLLNRPKEAAEGLLKYVSSGNLVELPYSREDCEKWKVEKVFDNDDSKSAQAADESQGSSVFFLSPEEARGILLANYAANLALLGDLEQAQHFVTKALCDIPKSPQAILTAIYLDLKCSRTQEAIEKMKQHGAVRFYRRSFKLNGSS